VCAVIFVVQPEILDRANIASANKQGSSKQTPSPPKRDATRNEPPQSENVFTAGSTKTAENKAAALCILCTAIVSTLHAAIFPRQFSRKKAQKAQKNRKVFAPLRAVFVANGLVDCVWLRLCRANLFCGKIQFHSVAAGRRRAFRDRNRPEHRDAISHHRPQPLSLPK
jgi:hypothetical protein